MLLARIRAMTATVARLMRLLGVALIDHQRRNVLIDPTVPHPANLPVGYTGQEFLACSDLANVAEVNEVALAKRLERFRAESDRGYLQVVNRGRRRPQYLYRVGEVWPIVRDLKMSAERPPKKKT
jgi:hypothetical protein